MFAKRSKLFLKINLVFAVVAAAGLFTAACVAWALPKQPLAFPLEELSQAPLPPEKPFDAAPVLSIKFLSVNFVRFRGQIKPHWHAKRAETVISLSDGGTLVVDGEEYPLKTGSLFFIPRRAIHEARCPENKICRAYSIFAPPWNPDKPDRIFINP
ncbi:MAG: cupin domain-containing protein [Elusimicrobia bacterium]|nr:cupin domain-containing protein [Elusimicrobiota bacterium]